MSLSVMVVLAGYAALFDKAPFAMFGLSMLSILLFVVGLQRTARFWKHFHKSQRLLVQTSHLADL